MGSRRYQENIVKRSQDTLKSVFVVFVEIKLDMKFDLLEKGHDHEKKLHSLINAAILNLKENPSCGIKIPRKLWPLEYIKNYSVNNLWKYDLIKGWRITYTIKENDNNIFCIILEWLNHKEYEKKFKY